MAAYISGYNNTVDVLGFGFNTQSAMFYQNMHANLDVHEGVRCDGCGAEPLRGIRWRCQSCPGHDICNGCKKRGNSPGHPFQITSMTTTNNQNAAAAGLQQQPEAGVHWTTCQNCSVYPIRGTMYACVICANYDLCEQCNKQRIASGTHPHRFDFFHCPRASNPPPQAVGSSGAQSAPQFQQQTTSLQQQPYIQPQDPHQSAIVLLQQTPQAPSSLTWTPPPSESHHWQPRGGHSDQYYHNSRWAPKSEGYKPPLHLATAKFEYLAQADDELSFSEGGTVALTGFPSRDWWMGEWKGLSGLFPAQYVELDVVENLTVGNR